MLARAVVSKWKEEEGKHYVWTAAEVADIELRKDGEVLKLRLELERLKQENRHLKEELDEAQMLIRLYENDTTLPPEVPAQ
jgi:predicted  nucleic acid-binding Zn-ribbon protein